MKTKQSQAVMTLLALTLAIFYEPTIVCGKEDGSAMVDSAIQREISVAHQLAIDRERMAQKLLAGLNSTSNSSEVRINCANELARLNYVPAIPSIVKIHYLTTYQGPDSEASMKELFPLIQALIDYGNIAVPYLVEAWDKEEDEYRKAQLSGILIGMEDQDFVLTYLTGYAKRFGEEENNEQLINLILVVEKYRGSDR